MRHQQTGEEKIFSNQEALQALMDGFRPVDPNASVIGEVVDDNGDPELLDVPINRLVPTAQAGGDAFNLPSAERIDLVNAYREELRLEEEYGDPTLQFAQERGAAGITAGATDVAAEQGGELGSRFQQFLTRNIFGAPARAAHAGSALLEGDFGEAAEQIAGVATMGVSDFIFADPEDPESFRERREQMSMRNPTTATMATIGGAIGGALLGGRVPVGLSGPIGSAVRAGDSFRRWASGALEARGAGALGRGIISTAGAGAIEGGLVEAGFSTTRQLLENKSLSAEQVLADAGLGLALGVGFDSALFAGRAGLRRLGRRMQRSAGTELLSGERFDDLNRRLQQGELTADEFIDHVKRSQTDPPGSIWNRVRARVGSLIGGADHEDLVALGDKRIRTDAVDFEANAGILGGQVSNLAERLSKQFDNITSSARGRLRLNAFADDFASLPPAKTAETVSHHVQAIRSQIAGATDSAILQRADKSVLKDLDRAFSELDAAAKYEPSGASLQKLYSNVLDTKSILQTNLKKAAGKDRFSEQVRVLLGDAFTRLNDLAKNEDVWGRVAAAQASRDRMFHEVLSWRDAVAETTGRKARGLEEGIGRTGKAFDARATAQALKKMGHPQGGEPLWDYFVNFTAAIRQNVDEFARNFDVDSAAIKEIRNTSRELDTILSRNRKKAEAYTVMNRALSMENKASGFAGAAGFLGGAGIGSLMGLDTFTSGVVGFGVASVVRPASFYQRLAQFDKLVGGQASRLTRLRSRLRKSLRGGVLGKVRGAAFVDPLVNEIRSEERFMEVREELLDLQNNPELLMDRLSASSAPVSSLDEGVADELSVNAVNGLAYLTQHLPPVIEDPLTGQAAFPPSQTEMDTFFQRFRAVHDPFVLLEDFIEGSLTVETANTVRSVFPQLFAIQGSILMDELIDAGEIPYQVRIRVGTLFGIDTDPTLEPPFLAAMANQGYQTEQQYEAIQGPRPSSRKPDMASHTLSETQRLETDQI